MAKIIKKGIFGAKETFKAGNSTINEVMLKISNVPDSSKPKIRRILDIFDGNIVLISDNRGRKIWRGSME